MASPAVNCTNERFRRSVELCQEAAEVRDNVVEALHHLETWRRITHGHKFVEPADLFPTSAADRATKTPSR